MREITDIEIQRAYEKAPREVQDLICAETTAIIIDRLTDNHHVGKESRSIVAEEILFIFIKLTTEAESAERLSERIGIPLQASQQLLRNFMMSTTGEIPGGTVPPAPKETREELTLRPAGAPPRVPPPPAPTPAPAGGERPLTREEVLRAITPKRTMATDIESVRKEREGNQAPFTDAR